MKRIESVRAGMKFSVVVYPLLIAIYPFTLHYATNCHDVSPWEMVMPLSIVVGSTLAVWGLVWLIIRNQDWAGLVVSSLVILFFTLEITAAGLNGWVYSLSSYWVARDYRISDTTAMICEAVLVAVLLGLGWWFIGSPRRFRAPLNFFAMVLLAFPLYDIVTVRSRLRPEEKTAARALAKLTRGEHQPDIYYIIMDGFARGDVLKELFAFDLEPFLRKLESKGFVVARESRSNYCQTPLSLSSSLNGIHHKEAADEAAASALPDNSMFSENAVVSSLRPLGYKFVTFASGFDFTDYPKADAYMSPFESYTAFHRLLLESVPVRRFVHRRSMDDSYALTRERTVFLCENLPEVAKMREPTFTFAHILAPHPPFVFGENGEDVSRRDLKYYLNDGSIYQSYYGDANSYVRGYRQEVAYLTKVVEKAIAGILENSPEPPIIVLQSDHGSGLRLDMTSAEKTDHHERMSILNAFYLPDGKREGLRQDMTPVNTFRMIFNNYFGTQLPFLADESYYSSWGSPQHFVRVTDEALGKKPWAGAKVAGDQAEEKPGGRG
jgi:hypothetical protein